MSARVLQAPTPPLPEQLKQSSQNHLPSPAHSSASVNHDMSEGRPSPNGDTYPDEDEGEYSDSEDETSDGEDENIVHVEVRLAATSGLLPSFVGPNIAALLAARCTAFRPGTRVPPSAWAGVSILRDVERVYVSQTAGGRPVPAARAALRVHAYMASDAAPEALGCALDEEDDDTAAASITALPAAGIEGLWETLIYEDAIKERMLDYVQTSMVFAAAELDTNVISWNRLILLYGPPGTGKTSLCRALAHKAAIRMSDKFKRGVLIEINSHSLFSKWFSESGKLVQKLFERVHDCAADRDAFVTVMIDEVESLTAARAGAMNGSEPGDALRVVNALLTQLDKLKTLPNVLVMATSNLAGSIDGAFIDRADIKQYVGLPSAEAVYWILASCLRELGACGLASGTSKLLPFDSLSHHNNTTQAHVEEEGMTPFPDLREIIHAGTSGTSGANGAGGPGCALSSALAAPTLDADMSRDERRKARALGLSTALQRLAERCARARISGRFLRRLPLVAHSRYLKGGAGVRAERWVAAFARCVEDEAASMDRIAHAEGRKK